MSTDPLDSKFAAFRASTALSGPGAQEARASVRRQRRRAALVGVAAAVLVVLGTGAVFANTATDRPQRLTPATAPPTTSSEPSPAPSSPPPTDDPTRSLSDWEKSLPEARIDLRTKTFATCSGPRLQFHDGHAVGQYQGAPTRYELPTARAGGIAADLDGDGRWEYVVTIRCAAMTLPVDQIFVLRGDHRTGVFTAIAGIHVDVVGAGDGRDRSRPTVRIDGDTVTVGHAAHGAPGIWHWRYRDGDMVTVSR